jgi:spermidine synthase
MILPYFGGGAAVWTACLLFFQAFLLLGYGYAHLLTQLTSRKKQLFFHLTLLALSIYFLPLGLSSLSLVQLNEAPLWQILALLSSTIGLPYLLLSSTGPLVQRWYSDIENNPPYRLYSLSNLASLLALISFPFCFEWLLTTEQQSTYWSAIYGLYCLGFIALGIYIISDNHQRPQKTSTVSSGNDFINTSSKAVQLLWLAFSAVGVIMLVSTTNAMTQNIPPVPFLWILPLCLYLLSFIISFHSATWYVRWYWLGLFVFTACIGIFIYFIGSQFSIVTQIVMYSSILFSACMICHGELANLKPNSAQLTWYYLLISVGGFLGSAFVVFVAQNVFQQFLEFPLAIITVFVLLSFTIYYQQKKLTALLKISLLSALVCSTMFVLLNAQFLKTDIYNSRNFYGLLAIKEVTINDKKERRLIDGTTSHGTQSMEIGQQHIPLSYYRESTGIALALQKLSANNSIYAGLIGLGAGTLAAYGKIGDRYRFYELNPAVINVANDYFSYLDDSKATIELVLGDGRVSLSRENQQGISHQFDILVIDAFSGDSIPQHLLTVEALQLYWQQLKAGGVLAIHISNSHLNLLPLMRGFADKFSKELRYFKTKAINNNQHDTQWVWLTNNQSLLNNTTVKAYSTAWSNSRQAPLLWTDNYSNLMSVLK